MSLLGWLLGAPEQRRTLKEVDFWLRDGEGSTTPAGISIDETTALNVPEVFACIQVIAQDVARCPLKLRARDASGDWVDAMGPPLWELLHDLPNPETTATEFKAAMTRDLLLAERAYAEIVRDGTGRVSQLWRLDPTRMTTTRDALSRKVYTYRLPTGAERTWTFDADRPPLLELTHWSPVQRCRDLIGLAAALDQYSAKYFANNARPSGVLTSIKPLTDDARQRLKIAWQAAYGGVGNAHRVAVLEEDLKFQALSVPNDDAQFLETRQLLGTKIAGIFRVPPHKIGDLSRATFSNIEQQDREYVSGALAPYFSVWEQALRRDLLTTRQYPRFAATFDFEALIQADIQSRMAAFATARQNGVYSANDIRRKLNENLIPASEGGDRYHMNGNMVPLTGAPAAPEPAPVAEPGDTTWNETEPSRPM